MVPLNGTNYPTWKIQCRMSLMKDGLWNIVNGTEEAPGEDAEAIVKAKFRARKDRALATIVLSIEPTLLYLLGDPEDPVAVWKKLTNQFQRKTWANKLVLRRKLHSTRLTDGDSVQEHVKKMVELFNELSVIGAELEEEDKVVYLLASLPDTYNTLVTALEANSEVPTMEVVTERLLHEERKVVERKGTDVTSSRDKAMTTTHRKSKKGPKCYYCHKLGHLQRNCILKAQREAEESAGKEFKSTASRVVKKPQHKANTVHHQEDSSESDSDSVGLVVRHVLSVGERSQEQSVSKWIVDSGATAHICNQKEQFSSLKYLVKPQDVILGDGRSLKIVGRGTVTLKLLTNGRRLKCHLKNVLLVPELAYNLISVTKAVEAGKHVEFSEDRCTISDEKEKIIVTAVKTNGLYYVNCDVIDKVINTAIAEHCVGGSREAVWHRRLGHLSLSGLRRLVKHDMVNGFDYDPEKAIACAEFCESCVEGKSHRLPFPSHQSRRVSVPLELVHSDVCGKINVTSLGGAQYFLTFIDDHTRYVWTYMLKRKDEVFTKFLEWKAMVENSTSHRLKTLRTDNGGEYTSSEFTEYLQKAGIKHELTIPKTPEQNGVAERMNRTLVEITRSMLIDSKTPHRFWAEALSTAVYLKNRCPAKAVNGKTPFEALTGEKPNIGNLRRFGCVAYAHIPKDERRKLDPKARRCIHMGYGVDTKGYRLYDPSRKRIVYSRDVVFNESDNAAEKEPGLMDGEPSLRVDIDWLHESEVPSTEDSEEETVIQTQDEEVPTTTALRRSNRPTRRPDYYGNWVNMIVSEPQEPTTVKEALTGPNKEEWKTAMDKELESIERNKVWKLEELPEGKRAMGI